MPGLQREANLVANSQTIGNKAPETMHPGIESTMRTDHAQEISLSRLRMITRPPLMDH